MTMDAERLRNVAIVTDLKLWPFSSQDEKDEYEELKEAGYALLKRAHEQFMAAAARRE